MNESTRRIIATLASLVLIGLSVADFLEDGVVSELLVGALLVLALATAGVQGDKLARGAAARMGVDLDQERDDDRG